LAYAIAMTEDLHQLSKAKPMVLGSALIWLSIFVYYSVEFGSAKNPLHPEYSKVGSKLVILNK